MGPDLVWLRSSACESSACVEVAVADNGDILVRDSATNESPLWFSPEEWRAFIAGARDGEFDL